MTLESFYLALRTLFLSSAIHLFSASPVILVFLKHPAHEATLCLHTLVKHSRPITIWSHSHQSQTSCLQLTHKHSLLQLHHHCTALHSPYSLRCLFLLCLLLTPYLNPEGFCSSVIFSTFYNLFSKVHLFFFLNSCN